MSFAEEAMRLGGKSDEEARRMGAVDTADDQVEDLFEQRYRTSNSPIHRAVWDRKFPHGLFSFAAPLPVSENAGAAMQRSIAVVTRHKSAETLIDDHGKISPTVLHDLGDAGYWGLLIPEEFGGTGASFTQFAQFLTKMATISPTIAGLASVHGCIGAVDPVMTFGNADQKKRLLPKLASGQRLSAFALTEPGAGSDLTALKTTAVREGNEYVITGEKLFITNVHPGRMIGIVCMIDGKPAVIVAELPIEENTSFRLKRYGLYALKQAHNCGIVFDRFRVPVENRLVLEHGDGLTIAYHGLNRGRVALCANAAGTMRQMLASMLPWAAFRKTYGEAIAKRELVQRRITKLAGMIVASDALVDWCSGLLDLGYRGEMECIVAKVFGSEAQKEAAIELFMKTHGGRSFLHGHLFGDNVHEFLAPCIYEGEGEMLGMAFFKSLVKQHGRDYFEPIGKTLSDVGIRKPNMVNPAHMWALRRPLWNYAKWLGGHAFMQERVHGMSGIPGTLGINARLAARILQRSSFEISAMMRTHQLKLADRQCRMTAISERIQSAVVVLCTSLYAARSDNPIIRKAAECFGECTLNVLQRKQDSDALFRKSTELGQAIVDTGFPGLETVDAEPIMMRY